MALQGDVETFPVRDLLAWLARRRATGALSLARGMVVRRFHVKRGRVVLASSSEEDMLLGRLLVERGLVAPEQLASTLAGRGRSRARLGRLLARAGAVPSDELQALLAEKARRLLADALTWTDGRFTFTPGDPPAKRPGVAIAVPLKGVIGGREVAVDDADVLEARTLG